MTAPNSSVAASVGWDYWNVTNIVQGWNSGTLPAGGNLQNDGFLIKEPTENAGNILAYYSSAYGGSTMPQFTITYEPWAGVQDFYALDGQSLTDRISAGVNLANGNLIVEGNDLSMNGIDLPLSVSRYYNSANTVYGTGGVDVGTSGWELNTGLDVKLSVLTGGTVVFYGPSGYQIPFLPNGSSYTAPPGIDSTLVKNGDGSFTLTENASGDSLNFTSSGRLSTEKDRAGNTITDTYDSSGRLSTITDTQGRTTTFAYGNATYTSSITQITDPGSRTYKYSYDGSDNLSTYTDPKGKVTTYGYTGTGYLNKITDPNGDVTNIGYDSSNRVISVSRVTNNSTGASVTTTYAYNPSSCSGSISSIAGAAGCTTVTDPSGYTDTAFYDGYDRSLQVLDPAGNPTTLSWTGDHNVKTQQDPSIQNWTNPTTQYSYDGNNNLTKTQLPTGAAVSATYGNTAFPYQPDSVTDDLGNKTSYNYVTSGGGIGQVQTITDPTNHTTSFAYDAQGNPTSVTDANGHVTNQSYYCVDGNTCPTSTYTGLLYQVTPPSPLGVTTIKSYDADNHVTSVTDGKGQTTNYSVGAMDRLGSVTYADGAQTSYAYDADGNVTSETDNLQLASDGGFESGQGPWSESAGNSAQLVSTPQPHQGKQGAHLCGYNSCTDQLWQTVTLPSSESKVMLSYWVSIDTQEASGAPCNDSLAAKIRTSSGTVITTAQTLCDQTSSGWQLETIDVTSALASYVGQQVQVYFQATANATNTTDFYLDDVTLNVASATNVTTYYHDSLNQLISEVLPNTPSACTDSAGHAATICYSYAANGDLAAKTDAGGTVSDAYDSDDRLSTVTAPNATGTGTNVTTLSYDAQSNNTKIADPNGVAETMSYDGAGDLTQIAASAAPAGPAPPLPTATPTRRPTHSPRPASP